MAKTLVEAPLSTRNARSGLPRGLHWRSLDKEVHLGYRKGVRGGAWLVRWRHEGRYRQAPLGPADDLMKAGALSFDAASKAARALVEKARLDAQAEAAGPALTVRSAVESYIASRDARDTRRAGREKRSDASSRLSRHVLGQAARGKRKEIAASPLAGAMLHSLTEKELLRWRDELPENLKGTSKRRLINDIKAALNAAYAANRERLPPTLPGVIKHALRALGRGEEAEPVARENQILSDADIARLLRAAREIDAEQGFEGDLHRMVIALAATGARFSQAARLRVCDFQVKERRLLLPTSHKGRGSSKAPTTSIPIGDDVCEVLLPCICGRPNDAPLLERWRHIQSTGSIDWRKDRRGAWRSASELTRPWEQIRDRACLPDVVAYALRHTSIVRAIRANLPLRLVAAMHDTSTQMIERHYAKWITTGLEEMARGAIVPLLPPDDETTVIKFRR